MNGSLFKCNLYKHGNFILIGNKNVQREGKVIEYCCDSSKDEHEEEIK